MTSMMHIARKENVAADHISSEWLGAEARVYLPSRTINGNRPVLSGRRFRIVALLASLISGVVLGGGFALFVRDRKGGRRRLVGESERGEPFNVSTEVTPCLDPLAA